MARDLHLEIAALRSARNKKRAEKFLTNDDVDGRLIQRIGHKYDVVKCQEEAVSAQVRQNNSTTPRPEYKQLRRSCMA